MEKYETYKEKERREVTGKKRFVENVVQRKLWDLTSSAHDGKSWEDTGDKPGYITECL